MLRQVPTEWEVVDAYAVEPVRTYVEDDGATIVRLAPHEIVGAYTFDMAPPVPTRPPYRKRHSHDSSTSKSSNGDKTPPTSRRPSHTATRPELPDKQSTTAAIPIPRTESPTSLPASVSSHPSTPKLTRLGSALSFFRTNTHPHPRYDQRRRAGSPSSSAEGSLSGSGSGSSDGDSEAPPSRHCIGRRRNSNKSTNSDEHQVATTRSPKKPLSVENPAYRKADLKRALTFARGELMKQVEASGKNALVLEGWSITVLRQASRYRINIEYTGRPAIISYSEQAQQDSAQRVPPFLEVIDEY